MKDSGIEWIDEIPQNWETVRAKYVVAINNGADPKTEGDIPVYGSGTGCFKTCGEFKEGPAVLLGRKGTIDNPQYVEGKYWNVDTAFDVKTIGNKINLYYFYLLSQCFDYKYYTATTTLPSMTQTNYGNMCLPYPPIDMQERIIAFLDTKCTEIDALIAAKEKTNALLKERRQSIIYEAVTKGLDPTVPMKDSGVEWIGEIPEGWEIAALKRLGTPATGSTPSKDNADYWGGDIPWVSSKDMKSDYLLDSEDHITQTAVDECGLTLLAPGTLIFCVRSGILRHTFPVAVAMLPVTINQDLRALSLTADVDPAFLLYYMRGMNDTIVTLYQKIGATVESIEMDWFLYFPVVLPSLEEQDRIVEALDSRCASLDQTVKQNEATIKQLKEYRQSLIYEAVTGKIEV
jgi:type I restriction enzyme S subunit